MAENRLKNRICRILRSSLRSCKSRDQISDVVSTDPRRQLVELFSPQPHSFSNSQTTAEEESKLPFLSPEMNGRKCPPASPIISPLNNFYDFPKQKKKIPKTKKKGRSVINRKCAAFEDRFPDCKYVNGLFSSDEDDGDEEEKRRRTEAESAVAVVKRSSDPYHDFRTSMVEMIVAQHIFAAKDLENLLRCFLSLNSFHHHKVIIQVFAEIWEAFFCNGI